MSKESMIQSKIEFPKEDKEIIENERLEIQNEFNLHEDIMTFFRGQWLACGMPIIKYVEERNSEREKLIADGYELGDINFLSKKNGVWRVLFHNKQISLPEWKKINKENIKDLAGKTADDIIKENNIEQRHKIYLSLIKNEWRMYRLGKFITIDEWLHEHEMDEEYNQKGSYVSGQN